MAVQLEAAVRPQVVLSVTSGDGHPLPVEALEGYGFTLAQLEMNPETGLSRYRNLLTREVMGQPYMIDGEEISPTLASAVQTYADSSGTWDENEDGSYTYTFGSDLNTALVAELTTVVGVYLYKDDRTSVANDVFTFVPDGSQPALTRNVVSTQACNSCHNPLAFHGSVRRETGLCITCHTDQATDPETGNSLDFRVLIHKLHRGAALPSVQSGTPYRQVGFRQNVRDYSTVVFPQDVRNCTVCHAGSSDAENYHTKPQIAGCTSCHDDVSPQTGENHPGRNPRMDGACDGCHGEFEEEFDESVIGAHTIPENATELTRLLLELVAVENVAAGQSPTLLFRIQDEEGAPFDLEAVNYLAATVAGPTTDYTYRRTEVILNRDSGVEPAFTAANDELFTYTFDEILPDEFQGTYAFGMEGYTLQRLGRDQIRVASPNPVLFAAGVGQQPQPRRQVVDQGRCESCHDELAHHGGVRRSLAYCVTCHNPTASDGAERPQESMPPESIRFGPLIHALHRGGERERDAYVVYGRGSNAHEYTSLRFPGNLADCESCHLPDSYGLPLPAGIAATQIAVSAENVLTVLPIRTICTSCHDSTAAGGHAELATTAQGTETCQVCHGAGREFDATAVHP